MKKRLSNNKLLLCFVAIVITVSSLNTNYLYSNSIEKIENIEQIKSKNTRKIEYKSVTSALKLKYTNIRTDYASDEIFANFRNVKVGDIKDNILYRGASAIDNSRNRAKYVNDCIKAVNVQYVVDLSDSDEKIKKHMNKENFKSDYFLKLYNDKIVAPMHMHTNYTKDDYDKKVVEALLKMASNDGPYFIQCVEGKNRTGFFCMILEALCNASYEEIVNDFMKTYDNYYGITEITNSEKYNIIKQNCIDNMLRFVANDNDERLVLKDVKWSTVVRQFLILNDMRSADIDILVNKLTK